VLNRVRTLRESDDLCCGFTMDAGPNVKVLCRGEDAVEIAQTLGQEPGVQQALVCRPGGAVRVEVQGRGDA